MASTIGKLAVLLTLNSSKFDAGLKKSAAAVSTFAARTNSMTTAMLSLKVGALAAVGAVVGVGHAALSQLKSIDALGRSAKTLGIASEKLAGLQHAAKLSHIEAEAFTAGLKLMQKNVSGAAAGIGGAKKELEELGLSAARLRDLSPDQAFLAIADAMNRVENSGDRVRLAMKIFGDAGMLTVLSLGRQQLVDYQLQIEQLGGAFDKHATDKAHEATEAFEKMSAAVTALKGNLSLALAPSLQEVADGLSRAITAVRGVSENNSLIDSLQTPGKSKAERTSQLETIAGRMESLRKQNREIRDRAARMSTIGGALRTAFTRPLAPLSALGDIQQIRQNSAEMRRLEIERRNIQRHATPPGVEEIQRGAAGLTPRLADMFNAITEGAGKARTALHQAQISALLFKIAKTSELAAEKARELQEAQEEMSQRGRTVTEAMQTPYEQFQARLDELVTLFTKGRITKTTFERALIEARETLSGALAQQRPQDTGGTAALRRGSQEAASAERRFRERSQREGPEAKAQQSREQMVWALKKLIETFNLNPAGLAN